VKLTLGEADTRTMRKGRGTPTLDRVRHQLKMLEFARDHGHGWRLEDAARYAALSEVERAIARRRRR
jgi:hypothetical protein